MHVICSKTEHHEGRGERLVPIFPELRPYLLDAFERAEPGSVHVISRYRDPSGNLRTQLQRIIRRAGLTLWPRLFYDLRATRQTELAEQFPAHVVCSWIGNTERVAQNHYLQATDDHLKTASYEAAKTLSLSASQKAAQYPAVSARTDEKVAVGSNQNPSDFLRDSEGCNSLPTKEVAATGLEPVTRGL